MCFHVLPLGSGRPRASRVAVRSWRHIRGVSLERLWCVAVRARAGTCVYVCVLSSCVAGRCCWLATRVSGGRVGFAVLRAFCVSSSVSPWLRGGRTDAGRRREARAARRVWWGARAARGCRGRPVLARAVGRAVSVYEATPGDVVRAGLRLRVALGSNLQFLPSRKYREENLNWLSRSPSHPPLLPYTYQYIPIQQLPHDSASHTA